jgi:ribosomal protein S18 acetylase RimI-like enzyme
MNTAKEMGAHRIILYSNTVLERAINMYYKLGFVKIPLEPGVYERSDIKFEMVLR